MWSVDLFQVILHINSILHVTNEDQPGGWHVIEHKAVEHKASSNRFTLSEKASVDGGSPPPFSFHI